MSRFASVMLVLFFSGAAAWAQPQSTATEVPVVVAQGVGTLRLKADIASVSIAIEARAGKAVDARMRAATEMTAIQSAIRTLGLPADAIKTSSFSLQPQIEEEYGGGAKMRVREYAVRNEIDVRVDNLDLLSEVLDSANAAKTSGTLSVTTGLRFDVRNSLAAERDALRMAVEDGLARAQAMAVGAGRMVMGIVKIEELSEAPPVGTGRIQITTRSGTNAPGQGPPVRVDTPIEPNQIVFKSIVLLTAAIR